MYKYSIIIPVYNIHTNYLMQCLNSVKQQTYDNYECILVNNNANSHNISFMQKWVNEHKDKFKLIRNQLGNCSGTAKNIGVRNATGDFIIFLDAGDYVERTILETINKYAKKYCNLQILSFGATWLTTNNELVKLKQNYDRWQPYTLTNINLSHNLVKDKVHTWSKCYAKNFLIEGDIWHLDKLECEIDIYFHIVTYSKANQIFVIDEPLYVRRQELHTIQCKHIHPKEKLFNLMDYAFKAFEIIRKDDSVLAKYFYTFFKFFFETYAVNEFTNIKKEEWWDDVNTRFTKMYQWLIQIGH